MNTHSGLPPSITVSSHDLARLEAMLDSPVHARNPAASVLADELNRAQIVEPDQVPSGTVSMHSTVQCQDELTGDAHTLTLVYPHEADFEQGRISILAPVGSALLGLTVGQSIDWNAPGGRKLRLRVTEVTGGSNAQAPAAG